MVRMGKVMSNLMVDVRPANQKLRQRAVRIVEGLTGAPAATAEQALARSGWDVRRAVRGLVRSDARRANRR
jgi:N-acetylmuramic acid 6-phosphate etherase